MDYGFTFANPYMTDVSKTSQETAGVLAKNAGKEKETAGVVANKEVQEFTEQVDMNQVAYATKPKGVGGNLDIGSSATDTSGSTAGTVACSTGSVSGSGTATTA